MTITATFSNGETDTYKGNRPVTAAWAIICRHTNETLASGHSLDPIKADKTANGHLPEYAGLYDLPRYLPLPAAHAAQRSFAMKKARGAGWTGKGNLRKFVTDHNAKITSELRKRTRIEIISL